MRTIKAKLLTALASLFVALLVVAGVGWYASQVANGGLKTVFEDRVNPLRDLKIVSDLYAVNVVDAAHKVRNGNLSWKEGIALLGDAETRLKQHWKAYSVTHMDAVESNMAKDTEALMAAGDAATAQLLKIMNASDKSALDSFVVRQLYPVIDPITESVGKLVDLQIAEAARQYQMSGESIAIARWGKIGSLAAGVAAMILALWTVQGGVIRPLARITATMQRLATGERGMSVPGADRKDEIGSMAGAVQIFKENAEEMDRMRVEQAESEARAAAERKADMHRLADEFQTAVGTIIESVSSASTELEAAATSLTRTAETTQHLSTMVASASEEASANVQSVASASEELAASVNEIGRQVHESSQIAHEAVTQAQRTDSRITQLSQTAGRISEVVKLITDIAAQTNLLALNATIEAARAGEAGRGFAVVAGEVKALAAQTAKATDEISTQISDMQAATDDAVGAIKEIGGTISRISEIAAAIASAVEEQGAATQEIARNVQQAAAGTSQVANNIVDVDRGAGETGSASTQVLSSAQSLSSESNHLKLEVEKFLSTVRAA